MRPVTIHVIHPVPMILAHAGLQDFLFKYHSIRLWALGREELVLVVNRKKTACKLIGAGGALLGYYRDGQRCLQTKVIQAIPQVFGGASLQFTEEVRAELAEILGENRRTPIALPAPAQSVQALR